MSRIFINCGLALALTACAEASAPPLDAEPGTRPAVLVTAQVVTPDDFMTYVAAFPEVPRGRISLSGFREFGNANVYTNAGYVFVEQDGLVKRFSVNEELELVDTDEEFSWADFGVTTTNASYTVFVSATRAYTLAPELGVIVVWDPEAMVRTDVFELEFPGRSDMESWAYDGYVVGDNVIWNVFSGNFDTPTTYPAVTLVVADVHGDSPPRLIEDDRCLPGGPSFVDDDGDYYVQGGGYYGYFYAYGEIPEGARTCLLRLNAGETELDQDFLVDYRELLGSYVSDPWYHVSGDQYVVRSWDPEVPFPQDPEAFYDNSALRPVLVDVGSATIAPYPDLEGKVGVDGVTREVDGASYYQLSQTGYVEGGNSEIVELRADGIHPRFQLDGFLLGLERLR